MEVGCNLYVGPFFVAYFSIEFFLFCLSVIVIFFSYARFE
jgi:hypothetical protein